MIKKRNSGFILFSNCCCCSFLFACFVVSKNDCSLYKVCDKKAMNKADIDAKKTSFNCLQLIFCRYPYFFLKQLSFFLMDQYGHDFSFVASIMDSYEFPIIIKQFKGATYTSRYFESFLAS